MANHPTSKVSTSNSPLGYLEQANDAVFVMGEDMRLRLANAVLAQWMNEKSPAPGCSVLTRLIGLSKSIDLFVHKCEIALSGTPVRFECLIRPQNSMLRWTEISLNRVTSNHPDTEILAIARDISATRNEIAKLRHQSSHDELTGLLNRREFTRKLKLLTLNHQTDHTLLYLDLDQFKVINDACGHQAGDDLLERLARLLAETLQGNGTLARMGGDQFAILLEDITPENARKITNAIRDAVAGFRFFWENKYFDMSTSIGIAVIKADNVSVDCVLSAANSACLVAKSKGRNQIHVHADSIECAFLKRETAWISRITDAFENDRFRLYYQNILSIDSVFGCFSHREILLRMIDEDGHEITPGEFVPAAEKYHLMPLIDRWVIRTLFYRNAALWRGALKMLENGESNSMPLCSINISGASLNDDYFPIFLRDQLNLHQIPPRSICFEITETVAINNLEKASSLIREMKTLGFRFSLDDFGSGMSSFAYLKSLPVDFLKIDGSLVKNLDHDKTDYCMVEAINKIAQEMGIKTIAEFVGNHIVLEKLQAIGVDFAQGYCIHEPEHLH
ncbi:MAG: EAL domain-containing protein [Sulfuricella denitrificans]|nr:EAL domain-containing protein [Sulfuricella denitrificans]